MAANKSPFFVVEEFISPLLCEEIIDTLNLLVPNTDKEGYAVSSVHHNERAQEIIYERLLRTLPDIQSHYGIKYKGTHQVDFEWCPEESSGIKMHSENSSFVRGKWLRTQSRDLTGVVFLCDYQEKIPFEQDFEVYGGKLEFPQHQFGFNPQRGTLIVFPSAPHFINHTAPILAGDLYQARFHITANAPLIYDPQKYPGNYKTWF